MKRLDHYWNSLNPVSLLLLPLSLLFCLVATIRRTLYTRGLVRAVSMPVPVIVAGNITVGGTGKTPLVLWLVDHLRSKGFRPGVVARGYGGNSQEWPRRVKADSDPREVGDEPVLLARRAGCPCWVGPDRAAAALRLLTEEPCDILISDDGMQHYRLRRDIEIAVMDGSRRLGNGLCLPAGPLRERRRRLGDTDLVVANGPPANGEHAMRLEPDAAVNMADHGERRSLEQFTTEAAVHAVAGIGNPERFFRMLEGRGLKIQRHPFPDHHRFLPSEIDPPVPGPVLMTEKDAVKCTSFASGRHWYLPVKAVMAPAFVEKLDKLLGDLTDG